MHQVYLAAGGGGSSPVFTREAIESALESQNMAPEKIDSIINTIQSGAAGGDGSWAVLFVFFSLAIGVSFFCSVWEAVLLSVTRPYIASLVKTDPKAGGNLETLKTRIDRPLISILTLNTIAHTMGAMGVASELSKITGGGIWDTIGGVLMTMAVLIASEIIPKNLGARYWRTWAPWVGVCLKWLSFFMTPVVKVIGLINKGGHSEESFSRDELHVMADMGRNEGHLEEDESRILKNLLTLKDALVEHVMTPRVVIFSLKENTTVREFLREHGDSPFSRIPLYKEDRDDITGFVLKDDILLAAARDQHEKNLGDCRRDVAMISELTNLPDAFESLVKDKHHLAIVHDEFGGVTGLVTMEDIVETLLGLEIVDEVDTRKDMQAFARARWEERSKQKGIHLIPSDPGSKKSDSSK